MNAITLNHVNKQFGGVAAIRDLSLTVPSGTICGLVGENGAGKSTTIRLLMGALRPESGKNAFRGRSPPAPQASIKPCVQPPRIDRRRRRKSACAR